jgi:hypothetical protein
VGLVFWLVNRSGVVLWCAPALVLPPFRVPESFVGAPCSGVVFWVHLRELFVPLWFLLRVGCLGIDLV